MRSSYDIGRGVNANPEQNIIAACQQVHSTCEAYKQSSKMREGPKYQEVPLELEHLHHLEKLLTTMLPRSCQIINICKMVMQQRLPRDVIDCKFYTLVEDIVKDDPSVICIQTPNMCADTAVIILPQVNPTPGMLSALESLVDWSLPVVFESCPTPFWDSYLMPMVTLHEAQLTGRHVTFGHWFLPREVILAREISTGDPNLELCSLQQDHIPHIISNWHYSLPHSEHQIRKLVPYLPSCGLFAKSSQGVNELACSMLVSAFGLYNILFTAESHRRKGYAQLVIQWLAKQAAKEVGMYVVIETEDENLACQGCLQQTGFEKIRSTTWYWYEPKN